MKELWCSELIRTEL